MRPSCTFWILDEKRVLFRDAVVPGATEIRDMVLGPDGLVYGLAPGSAFFVFDPVTWEIVHSEEKLPYGDLAGQQAPRILAMGPDKKIYALFRKRDRSDRAGLVRTHPAGEAPGERECGNRTTQRPALFHP